MEEIKRLMWTYEKRINENVTLIFQADGSGELVDFCDNNRVHFQFGTIKELEIKLSKTYSEINNEVTRTLKDIIS